MMIVPVPPILRDRLVGPDMRNVIKCRHPTFFGQSCSTSAVRGLADERTYRCCTALHGGQVIKLIRAPFLRAAFCQCTNLSVTGYALRLMRPLELKTRCVSPYFPAARSVTVELLCAE